jgi:hypothetical protein
LLCSKHPGSGWKNGGGNEWFFQGWQLTKDGEHSQALLGSPGKPQHLTWRNGLPAPVVLLQLAVADQRITLSKANFVVCKQRLYRIFQAALSQGRDSFIAAAPAIQIYATPPMNCNSGLLRESGVRRSASLPCDRLLRALWRIELCASRWHGCLAALLATGAAAPTMEAVRRLRLCAGCGCPHQVLS